MRDDAKIQEIAMRYIRKTMLQNEQTVWSQTFLGMIPPGLGGVLTLEAGELLVVSAFFTATSWYAFTTRRIISQFEGQFQWLEPERGFRDEFGNFKGYRTGIDGMGPMSWQPYSAGLEARGVATITASGGEKIVRFEYETGEPAMLPIYAARYWWIKHPVLDKLMRTAERARYLESRRG